MDSIFHNVHTPIFNNAEFRTAEQIYIHQGRIVGTRTEADEYNTHV